MCAGTYQTSHRLRIDGWRRAHACGFAWKMGQPKNKEGSKTFRPTHNTVHTHTHTHTPNHTHTHLTTYTHNTNTYTHTHTYIHTYIHTYTYTHTHIHTHASCNGGGPGPAGIVIVQACGSHGSRYGCAQTGQDCYRRCC